MLGASEPDPGGRPAVPARKDRAPARAGGFLRRAAWGNGPRAIRHPPQADSTTSDRGVAIEPRDLLAGFVTTRTHFCDPCRSRSLPLGWGTPEAWSALPEGGFRGGQRIAFPRYSPSCVMHGSCQKPE
jgi:hypothetical protein